MNKDLVVINNSFLVLFLTICHLNLSGLSFDNSAGSSILKSNNLRMEASSLLMTPYNDKYDTIYGYKTDKTPVIDGKGDEECWQKGVWTIMDQKWLGPEFTKEDFSGRFKIAWTTDHLYLLAEITDDVLNDHYPDPLDNHYKDDCLELFLDENRSGGDHTYNFNAFAYHVSTLYDVVDLGPDKKTHLFNDHINAQWTKNGNIYTWELEIQVFPDTYNYNSSENQSVKLSEGKIMGLSLAYCDNDGGNDRENFIGSQVISGSDKNTSWINASVFGTLKLIGSTLTSIVDDFNKNEIHIYPIPSKNDLIINYSDLRLGVIEIQIVSSDGKILKTFKRNKQKIHFNDQFIISYLPAGIYYVNIISGQHKKTIKTIKSN